MSDGMLSQEEINALLNGMGTDDAEADSSSGSNELDVNEYLTDMERDTLGEIGNISFGSSATALSSLLNQKVDITTPEVTVVEKKHLEQEFPRPHVAVQVEYTEGFEGSNLFMIKTTDAAIIADLMLGGDGTNPMEDLTDMHISAVQEAMNQMMGSASTSMSTLFNMKIDISPPSVDVMDIKNGENTEYVPTEEVLVKISFQLQVGDLIDSKIMQIVSLPFAKKFIENLTNPEEEISKPEEKPAPEVISQQEKVQVTPPQPSYTSAPRESTQHVGGMSGRASTNIQPAAFESFDQPQLSSTQTGNLDMLLDIPLNVKVELGRTTKSIRDILEFTQGSIIELDKLAGEPVDILVNEKLIAKGEVVVIDENFGVRVTDIVSQAERIRNLN
ncbi:flagellar motor switch phosphatase FliY [Alkalicoccobacillus murimartini]|uniref:Flagellar motor switch protein FliN/FliY n=1 Tax=Alkalicoccobacillus murimartini TaxID=171685 RepID=A0ABT9YF44_9BACI|nr:flagellar motor switch phosphatase FliY [Alkalicoccobacillus murimartini]MDQ0206334.1 flagellar motor switch protein FliN/FliY [Alkalicoccobacillus murimartini]